MGKREDYEIRPGARGGHQEFKWDSVKDDKHRVMYLGIV